MDYVCQWQGSSLDLQILGSSLTPVKIFRVDDVSMSIVTAAPLAQSLGSQDESESGALAAETGGVLFVGVAPNPVRVEAQLAFETSRPGPLSVRIFDVSGRRVRTLADGTSAPAGRHLYRLDARRDDGVALAGGLYFYQVRSADGTRVGRFVVVN